jgi:hypothetical protein
MRDTVQVVEHLPNKQKTLSSNFSTVGKLDMVARTCPLSYAESINRKFTVQAGPDINTRTYLKNN